MPSAKISTPTRGLFKAMISACAVGGGPRRVVAPRPGRRPRRRSELFRRRGGPAVGQRLAPAQQIRIHKRRCIQPFAVLRRLAGFRRGRLANQVSRANSDAGVLAAAGRPATTGTYSFVNSGGAIAPSQQLIDFGWWTVDKDLQSFTNDLRVDRDFGRHFLTVGVYFADWSDRELWYLGNNVLATATENSRLVELVLDNGVRVHPRRLHRCAELSGGCHPQRDPHCAVRIRRMANRRALAHRRRRSPRSLRGRHHHLDRHEPLWR